MKKNKGHESQFNKNRSNSNTKCCVCGKPSHPKSDCQHKMNDQAEVGKTTYLVGAIPLEKVKGAKQLFVHLRIFLWRLIISYGGLIWMQTVTLLARRPCLKTLERSNPERSSTWEITHSDVLGGNLFSKCWVIRFCTL